MVELTSDNWFFNWQLWAFHGTLFTLLFIAAMINLYFEIRKKRK